MTVYQMNEIVGTSGTSVSDAIRGALERATAQYEHVQWFEVKEIRGRIDADQNPEYQVKVELGCLLPATGSEPHTAAKRSVGSRQARSQAAQVAAKGGERRRADLAKGFETQGARSRSRTR